MQETMQDIRAEQAARIARATRYDALKRERHNNQTLIERLEAQSAKQHLANLVKVIDAANELPFSVVHDGVSVLGTVAIPNGETKGMIVAIAQSAFARLQRQEAQRAQQLVAARSRLNAAEAALKAEFNE
jgi:hypothetical protein